jgi:hypothetical protein
MMNGSTEGRYVDVCMEIDKYKHNMNNMLRNTTANMETMRNYENVSDKFNVA